MTKEEKNKALVLEEVSKEESKSGLPMFKNRIPNS